LEADNVSTSFRQFLDAAVEMQLKDLGCAEVITMSFPNTMKSEQPRRRS